MDHANPSFRLAEVPDAPAPELRFRRRVRVVGSLRELWAARVLIRTLVERELRARYKQAYLGVAWALAGPVGTLLAFLFVFQSVVEVDSDGVPYSLFSYTGLVAWNFFNAAVGTGGQALLSNVVLLNKVYCPREVFPLASIVTAGVDALTSSVVLVGLFVIEGFAPKVESAWFPVLFAVQLAFIVGIALLFSSVVVYLRDLRYAIGMVLSLGLFFTPVAYGLDQVPADLRGVYCLLNPLAPVIDGYRRTILLGIEPQWGYLGLGATTAFVALVVGYRVFKRLEVGVADVA